MSRKPGQLQNAKVARDVVIHYATTVLVIAVTVLAVIASAAVGVVLVRYALHASPVAAAKTVAMAVSPSGPVWIGYRWFTK